MGKGKQEKFAGRRLLTCEGGKEERGCKSWEEAERCEGYRDVGVGAPDWAGAGTVGKVLPVIQQARANCPQSARCVGEEDVVDAEEGCTMARTKAMMRLR